MGFDQGAEERPAATVQLSAEIAHNYEEALVEEYSRGYRGGTGSDIDKLTRDWGHLSYVFTTAPGDAGVEAGKVIDDRNAQIHKLIDSGVNVVGAGISTIPVGGALDNPVVKAIAKEIVGYGVDDISESFFSTDNTDEASKKRQLLEAGGQAMMEEAQVRALTRMPVETWTDPRAPFNDGRTLVPPDQHFANNDEGKSPWNGSSFDSYDKMLEDKTLDKFRSYYRGEVGHSYFNGHYDVVGEIYNDLWDEKQRR